MIFDNQSLILKPHRNFNAGLYEISKEFKNPIHQRAGTAELNQSYRRVKKTANNIDVYKDGESQ